MFSQTQEQHHPRSLREWCRGSCGWFLLTIIVMCGVAGPALLHNGIRQIYVKDDRTGVVEEFNSAVTAFEDSGDAELMRTLPGSAKWNIGTPGNFTPDSVPVALFGDVGGVKAAHSFFLRAAIAPKEFHDAGFSLSFNGGHEENIFTTPSVPGTKQFVDRLVCGERIQRNGSCTVEQLAQQCRTERKDPGAVMVVSSSTCRQGFSCGTCTYTAPLTSACLVVRRTRGRRLGKSGKKRFCRFPFMNPAEEYDLSSPDAWSLVHVTLYVETDPEVVARDLTRATMQFPASVQAEIRNGYVAIWQSVFVLAVGLLAALVMWGDRALAFVTKQGQYREWVMWVWGKGQKEVRVL